MRLSRLTQNEIVTSTARADCWSRIRLRDFTNTKPETTKEGFGSAALVVLLHSQYN